MSRPVRHLLVRCLAVAVLSFIAADATARQDGSPNAAPTPTTTPSVEGRFESQSVRGGGAAVSGVRDAASGRPATMPTAGAAGTTGGGGGGGGGRGAMPSLTFEWPRVIVSLACVLGLILLLRFAMRRWLGAVGSSGAGKVVRVLGRTVLAPRQQVVMLQVGRRVIVAADNAGQLTSLAQITDPDEVASLLGQLESTGEGSFAAAAAATGFGRWFGRAKHEFDDLDEDTRPADARPTPAALAGASAAPAVGAAADEVDAARGELAGLMDRIRGLSQQFGKK